MRDVLIEYDHFVSTVAVNRHLSVDAVKKIADGSTMLGDMALQNGLIDDIGGFESLENYLSQTLNIKINEPCIFRNF